MSEESTVPTPPANAEQAPVNGVFIMASTTQYSPADGVFLKPGPSVTQTAFYSNPASELRERFATLVETWKRETGMQSSIQRITEHEAYKEIVQMREMALPLIFDELKRAPSHWFTALTAITNVQPVRPEDAGHMQGMADVWLEWGRKHGWTT